MERRRKQLGYIATSRHGRNMFSSYDNGTLMLDPDIEWTKGNSNTLNKGNVNALHNRTYDVDKEEKSQTCRCISNIINVSEAPLVVSKNEDSKYDRRDFLRDRQISIDDDLDGIVLHDNNNALDRDTDEVKFTEYDKTNALKTHVAVRTKKKTPLLSFKSESFDCNTRSSKSTTVNQQRGEGKRLETIRSYSDTRNPLLFHRLNTNTRQFEDVNTDKNRKKYKYQNDFNTLTPIYAYEPSRDDESAINSDTDKAKGNKRWMRKLARYATFDEGNVYLANASESTNDLLMDENAKQLSNTDENKTENDNHEQCTKGNTIERKISAGKLFKQSMTQGISKFKQLSITGRSRNRKVEQNYRMIDSDIIFHETSKRLEPLDTEERLPSIFSNDSSDSTSMLPTTRKSLRRSFSVPDYLDSSSVCDEELSELYLPRRAAICPDLAVPAMNQLRTYLVLTRLKQYCIV